MTPRTGGGWRGYNPNAPLYRENLPPITGHAGMFTLPSYGFLEGFAVRLKYGVPNLDAADRIRVSVSVSAPQGDFDHLGENGMRLQMIARMIYRDEELDEGAADFVWAGHPELWTPK